MIHFSPGSIITYTTPDRINALGMVLPKHLFLPKFIQERGSWPTGKSYEKSLQVQFGYDLPWVADFEEESFFDRAWMPCGSRPETRSIQSENEFLASPYHVGVRNIEDIFGVTHKLYELVLAHNCTLIEQAPKTNFRFEPDNKYTYYPLLNN